MNTFNRIVYCFFGFCFGVIIPLYIFRVIFHIEEIFIIIAVCSVLGTLGGYFFAKRVEKVIALNEEKISGNIELQNKNESRMKRMFWIVCVLAIIFLFNQPFNPSTEIIILDLVLCAWSLFSFILYDKKKSLWAKRIRFVFFVYFATCLAIIAVGLFILKKPQQHFFLPSLGQVSSNIVVGKGEVVSLGPPSSPLGKVSVLLPVGFKVENLQPNQVIIQQNTGVDKVSAVTVTTDPLIPRDFLNRIETKLNSSGDRYIESVTTFLNYPASQLVFSLNGTQASIIVFQADGLTYAVGITKAANSSNLAVNTIIDSIVVSIKIESEGLPSSQQVSASTTPLEVSAVNSKLSVFQMKEFGLEMTVPRDLNLISTVLKRGNETDVSFSSQELVNLNLAGKLKPSYCSSPDASPLGLIEKPEGNDQPLTGPTISKKVNGTSIYLFSIETPQQSCSQGNDAKNLILKQSAELRAAFKTIRAF